MKTTASARSIAVAPLSLPADSNQPRSGASGTCPEYANGFADL